MAYITLIATLCHVVAGVNACVDEIVVDNTMDDRLNITSCLVGGQTGVVEWMSKHPVYHTGWTLGAWKCRYGNKPQPPMEGRA